MNIKPLVSFMSILLACTLPMAAPEEFAPRAIDNATASLTVVYDSNIALPDSVSLLGHEAETENYAIYPSTMTETFPQDLMSEEVRDNFLVWDKSYQACFPQIYYRNGHENVGSETERKINEELYKTGGYIVLRILIS